MMDYLKLAAGIAIAVLCFAVGTVTTAWRYQAKIAKLDAEHKTAISKANAATLKAQQELDAERARKVTVVAAIDTEQHQQLSKALAENEKLRASVAAGSVRLRVNAKCPAAPSVMSGTGQAASVGDGTHAELASDARSDYFALRAGIIVKERQLEACQQVLEAQ